MRYKIIKEKISTEAMHQYHMASQTLLQPNVQSGKLEPPWMLKLA